MLQQTWSGPPLPCLDSVRCKVVLTDGQHEVGYPTSASWPSGIDASRCNSSTSPMVHGSGEVMGAPHGTDYSFSGELEGVVVSAPRPTSHPSWTGRWGDKVGRIRKRKKKRGWGQAAHRACAKTCTTTVWHRCMQWTATSHTTPCNQYQLPSHQMYWDRS